MMKLQSVFFSILLLLTLAVANLSAQPNLTKDYSYVMEIPSVIAMESSPAHMYVLSESEGMVLFRSSPDSVRWLYSSTGMERRGYKMTADIRFAYLFGDSRRLTVLEPTSVLGVYSSTQLPSQPLDAIRMNKFLYVAMGIEGLGRLDLSTPASVDSAVTRIERETLQGQEVIDIEASRSQLFVLTSEGNLLIFNENDSDEQVSLSKRLRVDEELEHIFVIGGELLGSDSSGGIYEIDSNGNLAEFGSIGEPVQKMESWQDWLIIKGESNRLWTSYRNRSPQLWKKDRDAGNYFTVTQNKLWLCEYGQLSPVTTSTEAQAQAPSSTRNTSNESTSSLNLRPIDNITVPYPKPVLQAIQLEGNYPLDRVQFAYQSNIQNAKIRGNGFYWQPQSNEIGRHSFKIIATSSDGQVDSTSFVVDVRSFNAPPRFSPVRQLTIPVGEAFTLPINATDPDGNDPKLIRYIGVDLPEGGTVNEKTGRFTWTPTARQVGENSFQVVATDQYGAASQIDITIRVIEIKRSEDAGE
ncbi:putative Ig domain-containing protein [Aliifodinibius sp. S!AR15-10]|uniref:Ig-like domain-containing protein n=1 Tax=Aliifodinibius sp. S!AR15-10 TaxID=2950437 RepID=UPI0028567C7F|nr:putative Ig domain-containing protein [Aliifodinibius sp. S!AR15-10]MDR8393191.1 putative Ig domain-containing protein [Aliifodinibius sp. S!AR15-10]